jgi:hypothetical protein
MRHHSIFLLNLLLPLTLLAGQLGVNIDFAERGGTFTDVAKEEYRWGALPGGADLTSSQVDELGWPKTDAQFVVDYRPAQEWNDQIDDPEVYRIDVSGTYKCSFIGSSDVRGSLGGTVQNKSYDAASNTTTFDFVVAGPPGAGHGLIIIEFTKTKRTSTSASGSGFTSFRMMRPGYDLSTTKTFTDAFIAALTGIKFSTIRFMNFLMVNGCDTTYPAKTLWSKRKHKEDASQNQILPLGKKDGGAWEYVIELCNLVHMNPWINIPVSADTEYVLEVAKLFKANLDPGRVIYVESSNEVWNSASAYLPQNSYNKTEAKAKKIEEQENHARRTVELSTLFAQVFGQDAINKRVRVVLCSHKPMLKWWVAPMLSYVRKTFGAPKKFIYAIACQTYFGSAAAAGESVDKILADCRTDITSQIDETGGVDEAGRKQWVKMASDSGLVGGFCSYEGGPDHGGGDVTNIANRIMAERNAKMGDIWTYNYDTAFFQVGANLAMQFTLTSAYSRYGCWGLTDDVTKPLRNAKYPAAKLLADRYPAAVNPRQFTQNAQYSPRFSAFPSGTDIKVSYFLQKPADVLISLWNLKGERLAQLAFPRQPIGTHGALFPNNKLKLSGYLIASITTSAGTNRTGFVVVH